ncbi:potassium channel family protein [Pseudalkalibacillus salsuginis]|uniref:potassium channel family protein n=1 Tax=Pseudalkalibacillus salsuginis TaxID=2910972 RepID=UPI001F2F7574|nr:potassium channel family protein [Pseudalkalibacillus salsuginis]MCF6408846.1 potassium channel family protein [Pseudalkalibacillus salsuginis]
MYLIKRFWVKVIKLNTWFIFLSSLILILGSTLMMGLIEPETFSNPFDAFWWVMTTVTTVGYGDFYPSSVGGRVYAVFLYIVGIGLIGVVIGKVVDGFGMIRRRKEEGLLAYKEEGHIVIIGWSQKARFAIEEILQSEAIKEVVIIDQLPKTPYLHENVHYIQGDATREEVLLQANLPGARSVLLFADETIKDPLLTDGKTLLIVTTIERLSPEIHSTVEILNESHIQNFRHVKVDEFILSNETISRLAVRAALTNGISKIYSQLMSRGIGDNLYEIDKKPHWETYKQAFDDLIKEGATLIADGDKMDINRRMDDALPNHARLFVICDRETYERIQTS